MCLLLKPSQYAVLYALNWTSYLYLSTVQPLSYTIPQLRSFPLNSNGWIDKYGWLRAGGRLTDWLTAWMNQSNEWMNVYVLLPYASFFINSILFMFYELFIFINIIVFWWVMMILDKHERNVRNMMGQWKWRSLSPQRQSCLLTVIVSWSVMI